MVYFLKNLELLFIWNNRLLALPNSIGNINMIRYVDIRHNFIENLPTTISANWKNMYYFLAGSNPFCIEGTYVFPNKLKYMKMKEITCGSGGTETLRHSVIHWVLTSCGTHDIRNDGQNVDSLGLLV